MEPPPGRERGVPQRLGKPHVPDPGDDRLVEQRLAEPVGVLRAAQAPEHVVDPRWTLEDVGAELRDRAQVELEHGAVPEDALHGLAAEHEPRLPGARLAARTQRPAS
jgi:hypothetical protein